MRAEDWRPPLWTPEGGAADARRGPGRMSRIEGKRPEAEEPSGAGIRWLAAAVIIAVIVIATVLTFRFGPWSERTAEPPGATVQTSPTLGEPEAASELPEGTNQEETPGPSPSGPVAADAGTPPPSVAPPSTRAAEPVQAPAAPVLPPPLSATRSAPAAPPSGAPRPAPTLQFGVAVGTFLDRSRAETELARVVGASGLPGRLAEVPQEGVVLHAVVIGEFPSRGAAEREASALIERGIVDEARIISRTITPGR